ncbi:MAG TPA: xanthine dehydrogenase [Anaerolineae bacterium]|nr:xanthine dehydrogenase [Anaerolineae bacterium]HIQ04681.1 xanthine dehydrogenase [Anaerolineae bacterium]
MKPYQHFRYVGRYNRREDALEKVLGTARYVADYQLPGMLYARTLRSPVPHARIVKLDVTPALKVPGVVAVVTSDDFVDHGNYGLPVKDNYVLAYQKVRYVGDGIAAVAAETEEAAEAGIRAIVLELEELPAVFDVEEALRPDAPVVGPRPWDALEPPRGNLCQTIIVRNGEPEPLLDQCEMVLEEEYTTSFQEHAYLETEGALAIPTPDGGVIVYANNQSPFENRDNLVMLLGLPEEKVRVIQTYVGGAFGGKDDPVYEISAQVAALALKTGRPVRMVLSREESIIASYKREAMRAKVRIGATADGCLRAAKITALLDSGAYASMTPFVGFRACMHLAGAYRYDAVHVDTHVVYSNNGYSGAFRGFGNTDATACIEQAIDELAERIGMDPLEFRLRNALRTGDRTMSGNQLEYPAGLVQCLEWVREKSDWDRKRAEYARQTSSERRRGIGVAATFHGISLGAEGADFANTTLAINDDYSITLTSGLTDYGQGSRTVFTLVAAEVLGVDIERIHMLRPDTETALDSGPTVASRASILGGNATRVAAERLRELLHMAAADALACDPVQLVRAGEQFIGPMEEPLTFEEVVDHARQMGLILSTRGHWEMPEIHWDFERGQGIPYPAYSFGAQVVEVEVDLRTGKTDVLGIWAAHDGGKILFPVGAYGQMYGGVAQGIGYGLVEKADFDRGYIQNVNYDEYLIPTSLDVPDIQATFVETNFALGPFGAKNLAEPVMIPTAPAILNAIAQATGRRLRHLPATLERVLLGHDLQKPGSDRRVRVSLGLI